MREARTYVLRQRLLSGAAALEGLAVSLDDVLAFPGLRQMKASREEAAAEWASLVAFGYLEEVPESDHQYARITAAGLAQAPDRLEGKRDVRVYGKDAF